MMVKDGVVEIAALNLSLGKVITLDSDTNLKNCVPLYWKARNKC